MTILNKLLRFLCRKPAPSPSPPTPAPAADTPTPETLRLHRLDIQNAVTAHLEWRLLLNEILSHDAGSGGLSAPPALPGPEQSGLGVWLKRAEKRLPAQHPDFAALVAESRHIHRLARQALQHSGDGRMDLASTLLNTDFERSHRRVMQLLRRLQDA